MNIKEASELSGLHAKVIRHYEEIGIIPKAQRSESGYRSYDEADVHILRFVHRSRSLGFTLVEIKKLVSLWRNKKRRSEDVKRIAAQHIAELEAKILELQSLKQALVDLSIQCQGDERPDCPILEDLANSRLGE